MPTNARKPQPSLAVPGWSPGQQAAELAGTRQAQPIAWGLLLLPAVAQFALHLLTNGNYGIFRDEYYYLACASRPAWGYVDQPPLSIWLLAVWRAAFGDSVQSLRILPALCGSGLIVLTGAMAAQLGGRRWAQLLAGLAVAIGAAGLAICGFYSMNAFDLLFWAGAYYLLLRIARTSQGRWWPWLGLVLGLGLLNKIGLLVFGAALVFGLAATMHRRHFTNRRLYLGGLIAAVFLLPYVFWNAAHDWATAEFISNAKQYKISNISPLEFLSESMLEANPLTVPLWLGGLAWLLVARRARRHRLVGLMFLATFAILIIQKSKPYYLAASFPVLMAAGGAAWEAWTDRPRWRWVPWVLVATLLAGGAVFAPIAVPLLSPPEAVDYQERLGMVPKAAEVGHTSALPQHFSDRFGWEELARTVSEVYRELPAEARERCIVLARNYGQAGALEYWSRRYDLPPVYCLHNNYWLWGPPPGTGEVMIGINFRREEIEEEFERVVIATEKTVPHALESNVRIWVCYGLQRPWPEVWAESKSYI